MLFAQDSSMRRNIIFDSVAHSYFPKDSAKKYKKGRNQEKFSFSAIHFCIIRGGFHICLAGRESMSYYGCTSVPISSPSMTFLRLPFSSILKT